MTSKIELCSRELLNKYGLEGVIRKRYNQFEVLDGHYVLNGKNHIFKASTRSKKYLHREPYYLEDRYLNPLIIEWEKGNVVAYFIFIHTGQTRTYVAKCFSLNSRLEEWSKTEIPWVKHYLPRETKAVGRAPDRTKILTPCVDLILGEYKDDAEISDIVIPSIPRKKKVQWKPKN